MTEPAGRPSDAGAQPDPAAAPDEPGASEADLGRRRFFREFAGELAQTAATVFGAAQALQRGSAEMASALIDPDRLTFEDAPAERTPVVAPPVFRTAFRMDGDAVILVDQRRLPGSLTEYPCRSAPEVSLAIREGVIRGAPAIGQAAALGLAMTARRVATSRPYARRASIRGAANALRNVAGAAAPMDRAVDRLLAAYAAVGELSEDGDAIADAMRAEADLIVAEATADHGRLAEAGATALPVVEGRPLRLLVHGVSGALAGGQFGTVLGALAAAHHAGRELDVLVTSGGPALTGARITAWELAAAGVPYTVIPDASAGAVLAGRDLDAVLLAAERVAANGDLAAEVGAYPIAVLAARHGVPVLVFASAATFDGGRADGEAIPIGQRSADEVLRPGGTWVAPPGSTARNQASDVVPAALVAAIVTGAGTLRPPFVEGLAALAPAPEAPDADSGAAPEPAAGEASA